MLIAVHQITCSAKPTAVWATWADVKNWPTWDHEIESCELSGPFKLGAKGVLKPRNGPKTPFQLAEVNEGQSFRDVSFLPLAKLTFTHEIEATADGCTFRHRIEINGPLSFLFSRIFGKKMKVGLPIAMERLAEIAVARAPTGGAQ